MERIKLTDTTQDVLMKMSGGKPGALTTMMQIMKQGETIDPQGMMGGLGVILLFDTFKIYGSSIYILSNDQCDGDVRELLMLIRAVQLGFMSPDKLKQIADSQTREHLLTKDEMNGLNIKVCKQLSGFMTREVWDTRGEK